MIIITIVIINLIMWKNGTIVIYMKSLELSKNPMTFPPSFLIYLIVVRDVSHYSLHIVIIY